MAHRKNFSHKQRNAILRDSETNKVIKCACGKPAQHIHHIKPVCEGGTDSPDNLRLLCQKCHTDLHSKAGDFSTWGRKGGIVTASKGVSLRNLKQFRGRPEYLAWYLEHNEKEAGN